MKIILLALAIFSATNVYVTFGASTTNSLPPSFESALEEKCSKNSPSKNAFKVFAEAINNYPQCVAEALENMNFHPVEQHEEFCTYVTNSGFYKCLDNLAMDALPCLDKTEIFFPQMILKAYNTTFNEFCGTNGLKKTESLFNKIENNKKCIQDTKEAVILGGRCIENLTSYKNFQQFIINLNKDDYCIDMESFVSCVTELVEEKCDDDFTLLKDNISELLLGVCQP